jgi:hypothetical protein
MAVKVTYWYNDRSACLDLVLKGVIKFLAKNKKPLPSLS